MDRRGSALEGSTPPRRATSPRSQVTSAASSAAPAATGATGVGSGAGVSLAILSLLPLLGTEAPRARPKPRPCGSQGDCGASWRLPAGGASLGKRWALPAEELQ